MQCTVIFKDERSTDYILIRVFPLQEYSQKNVYPQPVEVWQNPDVYELDDPSKSVFILSSSLVCHCAFSPLDIARLSMGNNCIAVIPYNSYFGITMPLI